MSFSNFVMVRRDRDDVPQFYVVSTREPRFTVEVDSSYDPSGQPGKGFIKAIRINNSWTGNYHRCLALVKDAETFFRQTIRDHGPRY